MATRNLALWSAAVVTATAIACGGGTPAEKQADATVPTTTPALTLRTEPLPLPASGNSAQPQLTVSTRGAILSWLEHNGKTATLKFAERTPDGWSPARTVAANDNWFVSWADVPSVLRMSDGTLVATSNPATDPLIEAYDLRLSY